MSITITVNGQNGPGITATSGDTVGVSVGGSSSYGLSVTQAGTPGGTGPQGPAGPPATTVEVGKTTTLAAGSNATVTATSTNSGANLTLNFGIPTGAAGPAGANGTTPTIVAGTTTTLSAGSNATVTATTAGSTVTLNFGIPQGVSGAGGGVTKLNSLTGGLTLAAGPNVSITTTNSSTLTIDATSTGIGANDAVDGGFYVGEVLQSITFTTQPQSQNVSLGSALNWTAVPNTSRYIGTLGSQMIGVVFSGAGFQGTTANLASYSNAAAAPDATTTVANLTLINYPAETSLAYNGSRALLQVFQFDNANASLQAETLRSDDNGVTWSRLNVARPSNAIAGGPLGFMADAYDSTDVALQSTDGISWNTRTMPFQASGLPSPWRFAVGGVAVVGVAGDANRIARSTTGASWSTVTLSGSYAANVAFGTGRFVAIGGATGEKSFTSLDGTNWTTGNLPAGQYTRIFHLSGRFLALRNANTTDAAVSTDGVNWTLQTLPASTTWRTAATAGGYYAISEFAGNNSLVSFAVAGEPTSGSANLTVVAVASTGATVGYQWQRSTDAGTTWANVANGNTGALNVTNVTLNDNGTRYRVLATATGVPSAYSATALLTVN